MKYVTSKIVTVGLLFAVNASNAALPQQRTLTLDAAKQVADLAAAEAKRLGAPGAAIAIVDAGGNLVFLERLDNTFAAGSRISTGKARTAALFKKPTKALEDTINGGRTAMAALDDFTPLQGGVPIEVEGPIVGAIGISGASNAQQDTEIAEAAAAAAHTMLADAKH